MILAQAIALMLDAALIVVLLLASFVFAWRGQYELALLSMIAHSLYSIEVRMGLDAKRRCE